MDAPNAPLRGRRWLSFSLRALLIATTLFAVWLGFKMVAARRQHAAVEAIFAAGGTVGYDYQLVGTGGMVGTDKDAKFPIPQWMRSIASDDFFVTAIDVAIEGDRTTDDLIDRSVSQLPDLLWLRIRNGKLSGGALKSIGRLRRLESLRIVGLNAVPEDLRSLDPLKSIKYVLLQRNPQSEIVGSKL